MPFVIQRPGYIVSPYFDYLSFLFNRRWRHPAERVLGLMIKLSDSERGSVSRGRGGLEKLLTAQDRDRLAEEVDRGDAHGADDRGGEDVDALEGLVEQ